MHANLDITTPFVKVNYIQINKMEKRKYRHVYDTPLSKGIESTCKYCEIKVTPLLELSYFKYVKKEGYFGDTKDESLPECVKKAKSEVSDCKLKRDYEYCRVWEQNNCECIGCKHHL